MAIERFYPASSTEALAQVHVRDYIFHDPTISVHTIAHCSAYAAVLRFATTGDEYPISPRNTRELQAVLINHSVDVIHSLISQTRSQLPAGGYRTARNLASASIESMLIQGDNAQVLLALHAPKIVGLESVGDAANTTTFGGPRAAPGRA